LRLRPRDAISMRPCHERPLTAAQPGANALSLCTTRLMPFTDDLPMRELVKEKVRRDDGAATLPTLAMAPPEIALVH